MLIDWATLAVGVALFIGAASTRARAYGDRPVPSLAPGLFDPEAPRRTWIAGVVGYPLVAVACAALTRSHVDLALLLGAATLVGALGQVAVSVLHNRRVASPPVGRGESGLG